MKTIGLLGGMSWESTATYYRIINETAKERLGGLHSAKCVLYSVDFQEIEECQAKGEWDKSAAILTDAALALERAGADFLVLCTNTMHKVAPLILRNIHIPLLHIAQATAERLKEAGIGKVALLGTRYTMTQGFYKEKLIENGIEVLVPDDRDIEFINSVIYEELCLGMIREDTKTGFLRIVDTMSQAGARGVILGCTEIGLLIGQKDTAVPLFDTAAIHAVEAAKLAVG